MLAICLDILILDDENDDMSGDKFMMSGGDEWPKRAIGGSRPAELRAQKRLSPAGPKSETVAPPISQSRLLQGPSHNLNPANHLTISHSDSNYPRTGGDSPQAFRDMFANVNQLKARNKLARGGVQKGPLSRSFLLREAIL